MDARRSASLPRAVSLVRRVSLLAPALVPLVALSIAVTVSSAGCLDFPPELIAGDGAGSHASRDGSAGSGDSAAGGEHDGGGAGGDAGTPSGDGPRPDGGSDCSEWASWTCRGTTNSGRATCGSRVAECTVGTGVWECTCTGGKKRDCGSHLATSVGGCAAVEKAFRERGCCKP